MTILLVEDDKHLGQLIEDELKKRSFTVQWASDLASAFSQQKQNEFDLAIIDLNLPDGEGFDLVPPLHCPVIIMSALNDPANRLKGAQLGAVDFIPKPFLLQELFLKIDQALGGRKEQAQIWQLGNVCLDMNKRLIQAGDKSHYLNKRDYRLLKILTDKAPQVVSRNEIIDFVYGQDQNPSHRTIDNAVVGIRQMLNDDSHQWIRSVRGEGYQWMQKGN